MKSVIAAIILMGAVFAGSAAYTARLVKVSGELSEMNLKIQENLRRGNTSAAHKEIEQMKEYLEDKDEILSAMGDHNELDKIKMNLAELQEYSKGENVTDALAKSEVLEFLLEHMPENYKFMMKNVL